MLFGLAIISLILIVVIELGLGIIPCDKYKELNSIAVILSSGYFGSYIVYFLTIVIPEYKERKRTIEARRKMFIISTSLVTSNIIAQIRGGITSSKEITTDDLCMHLKRHLCMIDSSMLVTMKAFVNPYGTHINILEKVF